MQHFWENESCRKMVLASLAAMIAFVVLGTRALEYAESSVQEIRNAYEVKVLELQSYERLLANRAKYGDSGDRLEVIEKEIAESRFVTAKTLSLAEAKFQELIDTLATKKGLNITSRKVLKTVEEADLKELRVAVSARAEIGTLSDFLNALDTQEQTMVIDSIEIKRIGDRDDRFFTFNAVIKAYSL